MIHQDKLEKISFGFAVYIMTLRRFACEVNAKTKNAHLVALEFKSRIYLNGDEQKEYTFCADGLHEKNIHLAGTFDGQKFTAIVTCNKDFNKTKLITFNYDNTKHNTGQHSSV